MSEPAYDDYWERKDREAAEESTRRVALNPQQFGDQRTLFDAPLGQPDGGTFKGNPAARLYRAIQVPNRLTTAHDVFDYANRPRSDSGHDTHLGIHWQHDRTWAEDLANTADTQDWGRHGDNGHTVILEADHPGLEHVVDDTPILGGGMPDEVHKAGRSGRNRLTGYAKDWALIHDTVGDHSMNSAMLPEVPVRPGAPMSLHAVHFPDPNRLGEYTRQPFRAEGLA